MKDGVETSPAVVDQSGSADDLNRWLGRREAFGLMAGRSSAAEVECAKRIRDGKLYLPVAKDWAEFCDRFLHMSKSKANYLIALREKYGPQFFYVSQMTRISVAQYKEIAPAVSEHGIEYGGEQIPLVPENSERIGAAIDALVAAKAKTEPSFEDVSVALDGAVNRVVKQFREAKKRTGIGDPFVRSALSRLKREVDRLTLEIT